jgi:hypothetical protein
MKEIKRSESQGSQVFPPSNGERAESGLLKALSAERDERVKESMQKTEKVKEILRANSFFFFLTLFSASTSQRLWHQVLAVLIDFSVFFWIIEAEAAVNDLPPRTQTMPAPAASASKVISLLLTTTTKEKERYVDF